MCNTVNLNAPLVQDCQQNAVTGIAVTTELIPQISGYKWLRNIDNKDVEVTTAKIKGKVKIALETKNFSENTQISVIIIDSADNAELITEKVTVKNGVTTSGDITIDDDWINKDLIIKIEKDNSITEEFTGNKKLKIGCCEHAIIRGDSGDLIKEINIRLAGFGEGGPPLPQNKFDERLECAVKQFQRDYMKVMSTGIVCKHFLEELDKFCEDYFIKIEDNGEKYNNIKCPCSKANTASADYNCSGGFGNARATYTQNIPNPKDNTKITTKRHTGNERPGIHRSLLWAISAIDFYLQKIDTSDNIQLFSFSSGYRCIGDNIRKRRTSTNHMGDAVDITFSGLGDNISRCNKIRELFAIRSGACVRWASNRFSLEPGEAAYRDLKTGKPSNSTDPKDYTYEFTADTWVHVDCRESFGVNGKIDALYCKTENDLKGTSFISGNLVSTSDNASFENMKDCEYKAKTETATSRSDTLWLGTVKDTYTIEYNSADRAWKPKHETDYPKKSQVGSLLRKQDVVIIIDEDASRYKIKPRRTSTTSIGWIDKKYINQICKHEKDE